HSWSCDRRQLVDLLAHREPVRSKAVRSISSVDGVNPKGDELVLLWESPPTATSVLPHAIIVAEDKHTDFLAWVLTYLRHIRPFSAHCRIMTPKLAQLCETTTRIGDGRDLG